MEFPEDAITKPPGGNEALWEAIIFCSSINQAAGGGGGGAYDRSRNELTLPRIFGASEHKAKEVGSRGK